METAPTQTVWQKYWSILSSPRFHQLVLIFALQALSHYGILDPWITGALSTLFGVSITVNTVDRFNQSPPPAAPGVQS